MSGDNGDEPPPPESASPGDPSPVDSSPVDPSGGKLADNVMHFGRVLRAAGMPVGPGKVIEALRAVEAVGIERRDDFYWTLHAVFVTRRDQRELFDQAFHVFWRNPKLLERMMSMALPDTQLGEEESGEEMSRRLAEALKGTQDGDQDREPKETETELDAVLTWTASEVLAQKDFEKMSSDEVEAAKRALQKLRLPMMRTRTRRFRAHARGPRIDMRRTLRRSLRGGGDVIEIARRKRQERRPPLVVLCDISGSMSRYSRMLLHFLHAVTNDRDRVFTFLFGTRLTNVTRYLRNRDVDLALEKVGQAAGDWEGGTRIGASLHEFNRWWARRVLGQGAVVLLITDGLDREGAAGLEREIDRLHKSCRRLIWLNPLLRYEGFEPKSTGIRAILPHVDDFRPVHNLESLEQLAEALGNMGQRQEASVTRWLPTLR